MSRGRGTKRKRGPRTPSTAVWTDQGVDKKRDDALRAAHELTVFKLSRIEWRYRSDEEGKALGFAQKWLKAHPIKFERVKR